MAKRADPGPGPGPRRSQQTPAATPARASRSGPAEEIRLLRQRLAVCRNEMALLTRTATESTKELELSRQRYAELYELSPIGYATLDRRGVILEINLVGARLLGGRRSHIVGRPLMGLLAATDYKQWREHLARCNREPELATTELHFAIRGGKQRVLQVNSRRSVALDGSRRLLTTLLDVTERKLAEEALRESEANFRSYFENLTVGTAQIDAAGHFIRVNDRFCEITGYPRKELLGGMGPLDLDHPEDREADRTRITAFFRGETTHFETEKRYVRKNGDVVWVHVSAGPVRDAAGQLRYTAGVIEDITERKQAEVALRESRAKLGSAFASIAEAIFIADAAGRLTDFNDEFVRYHRFKNRAACSKTIADCPDYLDVFFPDGTPAPLEMWAMPRALRGETASNVEYRLRRKDTGETWWGSYSFAPIKNQDGRIIGAIVAGREVTDNKRAEAALRASEERLALASSGARIGMFEWNIATGETLWNAQLVQLLGLQTTTTTTLSARYTYRDWAERIHPDDLPRVEAELRRCLAAHVPYEGEYRAVWPDASVHWLVGRGVFLYNEGGEPLRMLGIAMDITDRKRAEESVERQRNLLDAILSQAPDAISVCDAQGKVVLLNLAAERLFGPGAKGQAIQQIFAAAGRMIDSEGRFVAPEQRPLLCALRGETTIDRDFQLARPDGTALDLRISATPVRDHNEEIVAAIATARDFTERKRVERELEGERLLLAATLGQTVDGVVVCLPDGTPLLVNAAARRMAGLDPDGTPPRISEDVWGQAFLPDGSPLPLDRWPILLALRGETTEQLDVRMVRRNGRAYDLQVRAAPVRDGSNRIIAAVASFSDITARRRHQAWDAAKLAIGAAAVSGNPLGTVLATALEVMGNAAGAPIGVVRLVDPETRDLVIAAERNLPPGYRQEAQRLKWGESLAGHVATTGSPYVIEDTSETPSISRLQNICDPPLGAVLCVPLRFYEEVTGTLTLGHPERLGLGAADVAELQVCADMLAGAVHADRLRAALRREADHRSLLHRELDHRVRNILATLIGLLHLTAENSDAPTEAILRETADRVARLADVHTTLAAKGHGRADLRQLVEMVAANILGLPGAGGRIRWRADVPPVPLRASQAATLALVLHELLTNCVKHAFRDSSAGTVEVEGRRDGQELHLAVCDDGHGAAPGEFLVGTGLTIVETLVTHTLQGAVWMREPRDGGHLAHIRFPLREVAEAGDSP